MSLFRTIDSKVRGLLGDQQFFDRLAQIRATASAIPMGTSGAGSPVRPRAVDEGRPRPAEAALPDSLNLPDAANRHRDAGVSRAAGRAPAGSSAGQAQDPGPRQFDDRLGWVAESMEAPSRHVGEVSTGAGDPGGVSYGANQLASRVGTMGMFLNSPEGRGFAPTFQGTRPGDPEFGRRYRALANSRGRDLDQAQHDFLYRTHFLPASEHADKLGFDITDRPVQEAIWSMSTQHSPQGWRQILNDAVAAGALEQASEDQLRTLYDQRGQYADTHAGTSAGSDRYRREFDKVRAFDSFVREQSNPKWPRMHPREPAGVVPGSAPPSEPVDAAKIKELQQAFDNGGSVEDLSNLAQRLNLEFTVGTLDELRSAIKYRDAGGKGAMISGPGFNPYRRDSRR